MISAFCQYVVEVEREKKGHTLDADPKIAIFVVARLIGNDIPSRQRHFGVLNTGTNPNRAFMNILHPNPSAPFHSNKNLQCRKKKKAPTK